MRKHTGTGNDNYGRPREEYLTKISGMNDKELKDECYSMIFHSARCANNLRADWHWMVDACYDEAKRRDFLAEIYTAAYEKCVKDHT